MQTKSKPTIFERPCYTLAVVDGKKAELTMYGEIYESQPTDWFGEKIEGQFIILKEFLKDIEKIKDCSELTIRMNSVGGDAYASIAIHNRLRELASNGMDITCIVDGVAMSGGSLIMCAADTVKVNPSSIVMIHNCWTFVFTATDSSGLRKIADSLDVINESQVEVYTRKTGRDADDIRKMMNDETYLIGRKALEAGFADELLEDAEDADIEVSADRRTLYACGHKMRIAAMGQLPEGIKTHIEMIETDPETDGGDIENQPEASGKIGGSEPMTFEEFRMENPEAAEAALAEARASVSHEEAIQVERQRIADIDDIASLYDAETVHAAKYTNPCTAQEMAFRAAVEMAKQGRTFMSNLESDVNDSGAQNVGAAPGGNDGNDAPSTAESMRAAGKAMAAKLRGEKTEEV